MTALAPATGAPTSQDFISQQKVRYGMTQFFASVIRGGGMAYPDRRYLFGNTFLNNAYYQGRPFMDALVAGTGMQVPESGSLGSQDLIAKIKTGEIAPDEYTLPFFNGDVTKLMSVLGTRAPNIKAGVYNPSDPNLRKIRILADKMAGFVRTYLDYDQIIKSMVYQMSISGTVFVGNFWRRDPLRFGQQPVAYRREVAVPTRISSYVCMGCGTPNTMEERAMNQGMCKRCERPLGDESLLESEATLGQQGMETVYQDSAGSLEALVCNCTMVELPFMAQDCETTPWALIEYEEPKYVLVNQYLRDGQNPHLAAWDFEGRQSQTLNPEDPIGVNVRLAINSPTGAYSMVTGENTRDMWLHSHLMLTPAMYTGFDDKLDQSGEIREQLTRQFQDGCKICFVNSVPVAIYPEIIAEQWTGCKAGESFNAYSEALFTPYRDGVDVLNTIISLMVDLMKHLPGETFYDSEAITEEVLARAPNPGRWIPIVGNVTRIGEKFFNVPGAKFDEALPRFVDSVIQWLRESIGITPALFGAGPQDETARGAEIRRSQALMQHQPVWGNLRRCFAKFSEKCVRMIAKYGDGRLYGRAGTITGKYAQFPVASFGDLTSLLSGAWFYSTEEAMPLTPGARRDWVMENAQNPQAAGLFSIMNVQTGKVYPQNIPLLREVISIPDWWLENEAAYNHLVEIVQEMMEDPNPGAPVPPPDQVLFDGDFVIFVLRDLLNTMRERDQEPGYWRVMNYLQQWQMAMQPPPMAGGAQPGGPADGQESAGAGQGAPQAGAPPVGGDVQGGAGAPQGPPPPPEGGPMMPAPQPDQMMGEGMSPDVMGQLTPEDIMQMEQGGLMGMQGLNYMQ